MIGGPFLFDSYALLVLLQKEKGFEKVVNLLGEIQQSGILKYLNAINLGEIIYYQAGVWRNEKNRGLGLHYSA